MWQQYQSKKTLLLVLMLILLGIYFNIYSVVRSYKFDYSSIKKPIHYRTPFEQYNGSADYLINTPGCYIPNYSKTLPFKEALNSQQSCGERAVFVEKKSNDIIVFRIDEAKLEKYGEKIKDVQCCYRFASRHTDEGKEDSHILFSSCETFQNGTEAKLEQEVVTVICSQATKHRKEIYSDAYLILKKKNKNISNIQTNSDSWNVLLLGMDTMSRARAFSSMPKTVKYLEQHKWLDYKGYQKVDYNTFPNLMAVLTGKNMSTIYRSCAKGMYDCNDLLLWSKFEDSGYMTAYGEDYLQLPDTFTPYKGFRIPPTDHYTRPFFLTIEKRVGNLVCAEKLPSALHLLNYASDFSNTYKDKFFGMFWLNSYSHNLDNLPTLIDDDMTAFFEKLNSTGVLNNTFVFFFSDHGIRFGDMRMSIESYYEERLPMFFLWVPSSFRTLYAQEYLSLQINQNRLTTPYDLHATLWNVLEISNNSIDVVRSEACPNCTSLFEEKSVYRTCVDANVGKKWCSCYHMVSVTQRETEANRSLEMAVSYIQNLTKSIETVACNICSPWKLKRVLRKHSFRDDYDNKTFYIVAFEMTPGNVKYEATVELNSNNEYHILQPTHTISPYNTRGSCVTKPFSREYCVCSVIRNCNKSKQKGK